MTVEKNRIKAQLNDELAHYHFSKQENVLQRTHPITRRQKISAIWNKEITIPLLPVGAVCMTLLLMFGYKEIIVPNMRHTGDKTELVEIAGNTYWKSDYERLVARYED
ncbi:hypothetical protein [Lentibacillus saliphilus]|uniref:hypothetical protein n=1 Tax=Lentibacillus saliphilus TaxID=2737028 RepID=UPI001C2F0FB7|nr:hypothetical protein [Lentibacillus saliphilus]